MSIILYCFLNPNDFQKVGASEFQKGGRSDFKQKNGMP